MDRGKVEREERIEEGKIEGENYNGLLKTHHYLGYHRKVPTSAQDA